MPPLPTNLGPYRVLGAIGQGAIAEVVRAADPRTGEEVALKILYPTLRENGVVVERFRREVAIVRAIQHPHVLRIRAVQEDGEHLYLVMDYHPGGDLADCLARTGRLDAGRVVTLARQLSGALAAAHQAGVVHRDVKPSNVLVGAGRDLDVRLCDFGLARTGDAAGLTSATTVLGTPEYMAPETVSDGHADPRSDLYSLGVVLYEAATGRLPFYADTPYQLMRMHLDATPPAPRTLAPELPAPLDAAIMRLLAKDPLDRFGSARDVARALEDTAAMTVAAPPPPPRTARACPACGGWLVEVAGVCADCRHRTLQLRWVARGGVAVVVTGPGGTGERLDAARHVSLFRLLDELPPAARASLRGRKRAPRLPFYAARALEPASADRLVARLREIGLTAHTTRRAGLWPAEIRKKARNLSGRYMAAGGLGMWMGQSQHLLPREIFGDARFFLPIALGVVTFVAMPIAASVHAVRPLLRPARAGEEAATIDDGLADAVPRLESRQDRRLVARLLDRLAHLRTTGDATLVAPLAERAGRIAGALAGVDEGAGGVQHVDQAGALADLRRDEQARAVCRAHLLRISGALEDLATARARAGALDATVTQEIDELALAVDAETELEAALRRPALTSATRR